jgi:hypothetical protein
MGIVRNFPWKKILLFILIMMIIFGSSACQSKLAKNIENTLKAFSQVPDHLGNIFIKIMGGLSDIGQALADQVGRIISNLTGR